MGGAVAVISKYRNSSHEQMQSEQQWLPKLARGWQLPSSSVISAWTNHFILSYPADLVYFLLPATKSSKPLVYYCFFSLLCSAQQTRLNKVEKTSE